MRAAKAKQKPGSSVEMVGWVLFILGPACWKPAREALVPVPAFALRDRVVGRQPPGDRWGSVNPSGRGGLGKSPLLAGSTVRVAREGNDRNVVCHQPVTNHHALRLVELSRSGRVSRRVPTT